MVAAHEVMHNLGGVQLSAPNASGGFHCIDEYDVMCYSDAGSGLPKMRFDCNESARNATLFDCGHNDYYHTNPAPGSYLCQVLESGQQPLSHRSHIAIVVNAMHPPPPPPPESPRRSRRKTTRVRRASRSTGTARSTRRSASRERSGTARS